MIPESDARFLKSLQLFVEEARTITEIAARLGLHRSKVSRWIAYGEARGFVERRIRYDRIGGAKSPQYLMILGERLTAAFGLKEAVIVPGLSAPEAGQEPAREPVFEAAARAAAEYLDRRLTDSSVVGVSWGRVARGIVDSLRPGRPLRGLTVVSLVGLFGVHTTPFEANVIAEELGRIYSSERIYQLAAPALARGREEEAIVRELPLVRETFRVMRGIDTVITSVGPADPEDCTLVKKELLTKQEVRQALRGHAAGEICTWYFDDVGRPIADLPFQPIGLGLGSLAGIVRRGGVVIAAVAADPHRYRALLGALRGRLINVIVTDDVTAQWLITQSVAGAASGTA